MTTRAVRAQELRGTVREAATGAPVPGAVVLLLDSTETSRARTITDENGVYRVIASKWVRRLRVVRIGFRPTELALAPIVNDVITTDVTMTAIPVLLEPVRVKSGATCPKRDDRLAALSLLEQARAGLLATVVAREARPAAIVRVHYSSRYSLIPERVEQTSVFVDSTDTTHVSFTAPRSAAEFVRHGFAVDEGGETTFDGPDAETLLDDDFRDGYCFQLRDRVPTRPNQVGLGFMTGTTERGRVDIDGTLWIDTVARQLKDIEFAYVNLPMNLLAMHPGGVVHFRELANRVVIVDRWSFRLPRALARSPANFGELVNAPVAVQMTGAVIASADWPGGLQWKAPLGSLRLEAHDASGSSVVGRTMALLNTNFRAVLDSTGTAIIDRLVPGAYAGVVRDTELDSIQIAIKTTLAFTISDTETVVAQATVPTAAAYIASRCRLASIPSTGPGEFLIVGRMFDAENKPLAATTWKLARGGTGFVDAWSQTTGDDGIFEFCGGDLHVGDQVNIEARKSATDAPITQTLQLRGPLTVVRLTAPAALKPEP
ncbi:MAG TPA: carboxypeptidase-like regulatory domain-containing protein [Gemmatimonadaceae bacterium]